MNFPEIDYSQLEPKLGQADNLIIDYPPGFSFREFDTGRYGSFEPNHTHMDKNGKVVSYPGRYVENTGGARSGRTSANKENTSHIRRSAYRAGGLDTF